MDLLKTYDYAGNYVPIFLILLTMYILRNKINLLTYYLVGCVVGAVVNFILKGIIKQPRPSVDNKIYNALLKTNQRIIRKNGLPHDIYGMPSGHTQSSIYSTVYIFYALKNTNITILYFILSLLTMTQRVYFNFHTFIQVIVGAFVGLLLGFGFYYLANKQIVGKIVQRKEDNGPV